MILSENRLPTFRDHGLRANVGAEILQPPLLDAFAIEICRVEPALIGFAQGRPFLVDDRIPRRIAVFTLHHKMLAEDAFELETEALGGALRRLVAVVAFPFVAAVAEIVEKIF